MWTEEYGGECLKCNYREGQLLKAGFGLELLDHAVQAVLMRGGHCQKLYADAGGPGPADGSFLDHDRLRLAWNVQLHGKLHARKGADDTLHAAAIGRKVSD